MWLAGQILPHYVFNLLKECKQGTTWRGMRILVWKRHHLVSSSEMVICTTQPPWGLIMAATYLQLRLLR
jgi:hypothetical protein